MEPGGVKSWGGNADGTVASRATDPGPTTEESSSDSVLPRPFCPDCGSEQTEAFLRLFLKILLSKDKSIDPNGLRIGVPAPLKLFHQIGNVLSALIPPAGFLKFGHAAVKHQAD